MKPISAWLLWFKFVKQDPLSPTLPTPVIIQVLVDAGLIKATLKQKDVLCAPLKELTQESVMEPLREYLKRSWWSRRQYSRKAAGQWEINKATTI